jgi:hypothetical protein
MIGFMCYIYQKNIMKKIKIMCTMYLTRKQDFFLYFIFEIVSLTFAWISLEVAGITDVHQRAWLTRSSGML